MKYFQFKNSYLNGDFDRNNKLRVENLMDEIDILLIKKTEKLNNESEEFIKKKFNELSSLISIKISEKERLNIVRAVGLEKGSWFKCKNGHPYVIGECGGPVEKAKCPECMEVIGGLNHIIVEGNELASEIDGTTLPANISVFNS
ncbi:unnamed protein product [Brachionus calyciflorus]|uniref:RZ-type domain-containing protein n=1 Tax=Brachionus calyciflorus TaxID=104777 RepID=A0A813UNH9_9BILA|nr:unnamed protein product [Brachionus calyciflorus]